jgi:hypothetical protein
MAESAAKKDADELTYVPGPDDPAQTRWRGFTFQANVPRKIDSAEMLEAARGNPHFRVNGEKPAPSKVEPTTTNQYRGWAIKWVRECKSLDDLIGRWASERSLRDKCEVGDDDLRQMRPFIDPAFENMMKAEGLRPMDVSALLLRHGLASLEWRA